MPHRSRWRTRLRLPAPWAASGRDAERASAEARILGDAGVALAAAEEPHRVAHLAARAAHDLVRAAGVPEPLRVSVLVGDDRELRVLAREGGDERMVGLRVDLGALRHSDQASVLERVLDGGHLGTIGLGADELDRVREVAGLPAGPPGAVLLALCARGRLRGLLMLAGVEHDHGLGPALTTLGSEVALTLEVLELTADLARRERRLTTLLANSSDVLTVLDADLIVRFEGAAVQQFGWSARDVVGRHAADLVHGDDAASVRHGLERCVDRPGTPQVLTYRIQARDGGWRHVESIATNLLHDPDVDGILINSRDVTERAALEAQLEHQALHDPLTGLPNRTLFIDRLMQATRRASRLAHPPVVFYVDLDDFKPINDAYGHDLGDQVLVAVAERIRDNLREGDSAGRLGGDEFVVLLEDLESHAVGEVARRLVDAIGEPFEVGGHTLVLSASLGAAQARSDWGSDELLQAADLAMYEAKHAGKASWQRYHDGMRHPSERAELLVDLRRALDRGELGLHYQPIVDLHTGRVRAVEALLRWEHPERGLVPPSRFVPLAERSALIGTIGAWVLETGASQLRAWRDRDIGCELRLSVNVSTVQLRDQHIGDRLAQAIERGGLEARDVTLEVTESAFTKDLAAIVRQLRTLKELGARLAVDDFGAGHAGLGYLQHLPADELKIDRSLVGEIERNPVSNALVESVLDLADKLGLDTVAEGIERGTQLELLVELGCRTGQGFYFARPQPADVIEALLTTPGYALTGSAPRLGVS